MDRDAYRIVDLKKKYFQHRLKLILRCSNHNLTLYTHFAHLIIGSRKTRERICVHLALNVPNKKTIAVDEKEKDERTARI